MLATEGFCPLRLPVGMIRSGWICSTDSPPVTSAPAKTMEPGQAGTTPTAAGAPATARPSPPTPTATYGSSTAGPAAACTRPPTPPAATAPPIASPGAGTAAVGESEALPRDGFEVVNSALSDNCQVAEGLRCMKCGAVTTQARHDGRGWTLARLDLVADRHRCLPRVSDADDSTDSTLDQIQDCTCVEFCDDDPKSACGLAGRRHVHPASQGAGLGPCSVHPDAPGDV